MTPRRQQKMKILFKNTVKVLEIAKNQHLNNTDNKDLNKDFKNSNKTTYPKKVLMNKTFTNINVDINNKYTNTMDKTNFTNT